jgi:CHAT domain-containing protein/tetratricopeptide (TPR) repeat protein
MRRQRGLTAFLFFILCSLSWVFPEECVGLGVQNADTSLEALIEKGKSLYSAGEFENAAALFKKALGLSREIGAPQKEALCLSQLGIASWDMGQISESAKLFKDAYLLARQHGDLSVAEANWKFLEITRLYNLGKEYRLKSLNKQSLDCFKRAIAVGRTTGIDNFELKCLRQKSLTYWQIDDVEMFFECNKQGVDLSRKTNHRKELGKFLNYIGAYYEKTSDYSYALKYFEEAQIESKKANDLLMEAECLSNIGGVYLDLDILDYAESYYERALVIDRTLGDKVNVAMDLNNIGIVVLNNAHLIDDHSGLDNSLQCFQECLQLLNEQENSTLAIQVMNNIGYISYMKGRYSDAANAFENCLSKAERIGYEEGISVAHLNLGNMGLKSGNYQLAEAHFINAINTAIETNSKETLWEAYFGLSQCREASNDLRFALANYKKSIGIIEKIRDHITLDIFKIGFARNKFTVYEHAIDILHSFYMSSPSEALLEEMFSMIEKAKARAFLEGLAEGRIDLSRVLNLAKKKREREVSKEISEVVKQLAGFQLRKAGKENLLRELDRKEEEFLRVISDIKTEYRKAGIVASPEICAISEVKNRLLERHRAFLEYFVGEKKSYLIFFTRDRSGLYELPGRSSLENSLKGFLKTLAVPSRGPFIGMRAGERIARELVFPLQEKIYNEINSLIIIPDGVLNYLPFETLRVETNGGRCFLIEKYGVSYGQSASSLLFLKQTLQITKRNKDLLAVGSPKYGKAQKTGISQKISRAEVWTEIYRGDGFSFESLPFSKNEILDIVSNFPERKVDVFLEREANESVIKKLPLSEYQIIHFACHGFLDEKSPFRSALVLSLDEGQGEDGFLQVREINNLRINADLVVLSACQTGNGSLEKGEGLLGLSRTFFYAGARAVLSALWPVNDQSTAALMGDFYRFLVQGQGKDEALRLAKMKMLKSTRRHPFYWAGFVLHGDAASISFGNSKLAH